MQLFRVESHGIELVAKQVYEQSPVFIICKSAKP